MNFLKSNIARIVIGILWGLGLACIFQQTCKGRKCIVYKAPNPQNITSKIHKYGNKCYSYTTQATKCSGNDIE
tara:strand:- start:2161 stop:2379 length:219 start_codon:yes stop_codon:yes gene_type:complete